MDDDLFESKEWFQVRAQAYQYVKFPIGLDGKREEIISINLPMNANYKEIMANVRKQNNASW